MKKPVQVSRRSNAESARPQPKETPRLTNQQGRGEHALTTTLTAETGVPGMIVRETGEIKTGALGWTREHFDQAVRAGRFLRTEIPYEPVAAPNEKRYERFLESLSGAQRHALRDSVPLYWIDGEGRTVLISCRGELPGSPLAYFEADDLTPNHFAFTLQGEVVRTRIVAVANEKEIRCVVIPQDWNEVAAIDFTGCVDRDCAERIIYKTPEGELKAATSFDEGGRVLDDVTRQQVVRWILECVIPEEFEPDFRRALSNLAAKGGAN